MRLLVIASICVLLTGCDAVYRMLDKEGAEEKDLIGEILPHENNEHVEEVQALLHLYGYNPGKVDGLLGLRTRNTIEQFQRDNNLEPSRFIDRATWKKLNVFKDNGFIVDRQLNVQLVQEALEAAGYDPGGIDGKFGEKTKVSVHRFQQDHGLKVDGKVGYQTLQKLSEYMKNGLPNGP